MGGPPALPEGGVHSWGGPDPRPPKVAVGSNVHPSYKVITGVFRAEARAESRAVRAVARRGIRRAAQSRAEPRRVSAPPPGARRPQVRSRLMV